jgi:hypothetical protein
MCSGSISGLDHLGRRAHRPDDRDGHGRIVSNMIPPKVLEVFAEDITLASPGPKGSFEDVRQ